MSTQYHIGTPGKKWGSEEKVQWLSEQSKKRSYKEEAEKRFLHYQMILISMSMESLIIQ